MQFLLVKNRHQTLIGSGANGLGKLINFSELKAPIFLRYDLSPNIYIYF